MSETMDGLREDLDYFRAAYARKLDDEAKALATASRLESELREALKSGDLWMIRCEAAESALSAERTARRVMREAWGALRANILVCEGGSAGMRGAWFRQGDEVALIQAVDAALAAEPGEGGPVAGGAEAIRRGEALAKGLEIILKQVVASLDDPLLSAEVEAKVNDFRAALALPPEWHPRAAEVKNEG